MQLIRIRYAIIFYFRGLPSFCDAIVSPVADWYDFRKRGHIGNSNFACDYSVVAYPFVLGNLLGSTQST